MGILQREEAGQEEEPQGSSVGAFSDLFSHRPKSSTSDPEVGPQEAPEALW